MFRSNRQSTLKYCAYALVLLVCFVLQNARGTALSLWGATMDVLPFLVASVALFDGPYAGGAFGFVAGLFSSLHSLVVEGLSALALGLFGVAFGWLAVRYLRPILFSAMLGGLAYLLVQGVLRYVFYYALVFGVDVMSGLWHFLGGLLLPLLPGVGVFYVVRSLHMRFREVE